MQRSLHYFSMFWVSISGLCITNNEFCREIIIGLFQLKQGAWFSVSEMFNW